MVMALPLRLSGDLALLDLHRHVAVDDQAARGIARRTPASTRSQNAGLVDELEVGVLGLVVRRLVGDEVALEGGDAVLAEQRRAAARSTGTRAGRGRRRAWLSSARTTTRSSASNRARPARGSPSTVIGRNSPSLVHRHAAVEDQVVVARAATSRRARRGSACAAQSCWLARNERRRRSMQLALLGRQLVRVARGRWSGSCGRAAA